MRVIWLVIIKFFFILTFYGQTVIPTAFNLNSDLYVNTQDNGSQVVATENKLFTIGTIVDTIDNSYSTCISVRDTNGMLLSKKKVDFPNYGYYSINRIVKNPSQDIYGVGSAINYSDTINDADLTFTKFDATGDTIFTRIFHDTGSVFPYDIIPYYNNTFLVLAVYATDYNNAEYAKTNLIVIDTLGNIIKSSYTGLTLESPYILLLDSNKHQLYTLGIKKSQPGNSFVLYNFLRCFNDTSLQSKFLKNNITGQANDYIQGASFYEGSIYATFAIMVYSPPVPGPGKIIKLAKFKLNNQSLSSQWHSFLPNDTTGYASASNVIIDNGKVVFEAFNAYTGFNFYFCDTSLNEICRAKFFSPDTSTYIYPGNIELTGSKKLASTGACVPLYSGMSVNHWSYLSTSYLQFIQNNCENDVGISEWNVTDVQLLLYPNPSNDYVYISVPFGSAIITAIAVTNICGQTILSKIVLPRSDKFTLDISQFERGMYFVSVRFDTNQTNVLKLIKN